MEFLVGGRYACMTCLRRGTEVSCVRCGDRADVIDLESPDGRFRLAMTRAAGRLGNLGIPFWDPRSFGILPLGRSVLRLGSALAFVAGFAWPFVFDRSFDYHESSQLELVTRTVVACAVGFAGAAIWIGVVSVVVLALLGVAGVLAQGMTALAALFAALSRVLPAGAASRAMSRAWLSTTVAAQQNVMRAALESVERAFTPRLRAGPIPLRVDAPTELRGQLRAPAPPIVAVHDDSGSVEVRDARVSPFEVIADDGSVASVDLTNGSVEFSGELHEGEEARAAMPAWADSDPDRGARARYARIPPGVRVEIAGGEWSEELDPGGTLAGFRSAPVRKVLRGTTRSPARVRVVGARSASRLAPAPLHAVHEALPRSGHRR